MPGVALHTVVQILRPTMLDPGQGRTKCYPPALSLICCHPGRSHARLIDRAFEECLCRFSVPPLSKIGIHNLPVLISRSVDIRPFPIEPTVWLVYAPFSTNGTSIGTSSFAEQREKPLDPTIDGAPIKHETSLGEPLDNIGLAQPIAHVPAYSKGDDIIREAVVGESTG